jgi:hypothetical protein
MIETFGMMGNAMSRQDLSAIVQDVVNGKKKEEGNGFGEDIRSLQVVQSPAYSLVPDEAAHTQSRSDARRCPALRDGCAARLHDE